MLTELYQQLFHLLSEIGFTAYAEDAVPDCAAFPYVTCRIEPPLSLHEAGCVHLTCWQRGSAAHADRLAAGDALIRLVPVTGRKMALTDGLAVLFRGGTQPVSYPECKGALGVVVRHTLRVFTR